MFCRERPIHTYDKQVIAITYSHDEFACILLGKFILCTSLRENGRF